MKYLLDANTLIEAKNRYYHMKVCPAYWQWLLKKGAAQAVGSVSFVRDELLRGNDELKDWVSVNKGLFLEVADAATQTEFASIASYVASQSSLMKFGAMDEFLACADPWLIAKAKVLGATVVTHEVLNLDVRRKFIIPNLCRHFGVPYINTFELLLSLDAEFVLAA